MTRARGSLLSKVLWTLRRRPARVAELARGYALFVATRGLLRVVPTPGVTAGPGVRLQRLRSVSAEAPDARVTIGAHSVIYEDARLEAYGGGRIEIGACAVIGGARIVSRARVTVGERLLASWNVFVQDFDPHPLSRSARADQVRSIVSSFRPRFDPGFPPPAVPAVDRAGPAEFSSDPIVIGDDVWLGANVTVLKGARIGDGCVVATGSVVGRGDYPPRSLLAGVPAKVIKELPE